MLYKIYLHLLQTYFISLPYTITIDKKNLFNKKTFFHNSPVKPTFHRLLPFQGLFLFEAKKGVSIYEYTP